MVLSNLKLTNYSLAVVLLSVATVTPAQNTEDAWLKRNWGNMIAHFNIYFNATQTMEVALNGLTKKQKDDFNSVLDIYPYGTQEDAKGMKESMEATMKKASKVIQNKPRSKWADNAYFLIGQTQFFSGDYYAALETFQFINTSYTDPNMKVMCQLWLMKSYIQQGKLDDAEAILGLLQKNKSTYHKFKTHLNLSGGDLLIKQGKSNEALPLLMNGLQHLKDKTLKYRTHFVLGQIMLEQKKFGKATTHFMKVLRLNAPYEYVFQANLGMAKSSAQSGGQGIQKTKKYLKRMLDDDKNIEYFDQIYYELAKLEFSTKNEVAGLNYMRKSAQNASNNNTQRTKTYLFLADYFFSNRSYEQAQAYYDSTVAVIPKEFENADKIKAKHSILSKLIENIKEINTQDSLLALSALDRDVLDKKIAQKIEREEAQKREEAEEAKIRQEQNAMNSLNNAGGANLNTNASVGAIWYFYNTASVGRGENEFKRTWANRAYGDFWRFGNKKSMEKELLAQDDKANEEETANPDNYISSQDEDQEAALKDIDAAQRAYYADIPFSATAKLVANRKIQTAYLTIGKIYYDELHEYTKSKKELTSLVTKYPKSIYEPEAYFYLSRASNETGDSADAKDYATKIAEEYPETLYNNILNNKAIKEDNSDKEVVIFYTKMYEAFTSNNLDEAVSIKKQIDRDYPGNSIQGKIDYLYALTLGKQAGKDVYIQELEIVKETYTGTEVGEMAAYTLRLLTSESSTKESEIYAAATSGTYFYVLTGNTTKETEVEIELNNYNKRFFGATPLLVKSIVFGNKQLFYIKQFDQLAKAKEYHKDIISSQDFIESAGLKNAELFYVSEENFKPLIKSKNEKEYLHFFSQTYN